jgi:hypothetical protein
MCDGYLKQTKIASRLFPITARLKLVSDLLIVVQALKTCPLNRRNMDENVLAAVVRRNKAIALRAIEPLNGARRHAASPISTLPGRYCHGPRNPGLLGPKTGGQKVCRHKANHAKPFMKIKQGIAAMILSVKLLK